MAHDRDTDLDETRRDIDDRSAALNLHSRCATVLKHQPGVSHRVIDAGPIGQKRHVGDHQRVLRSPTHGAGMVEHGLDRDG